MKFKKNSIIILMIVSILFTSIFWGTPAQASGEVYDPNVAGYWEFTSGSANDISGNGNHGILGYTSGANPNPVEGIDKEALNFSGTNYVTVPNSPLLNYGTNDLSVAFWIKTSSTKTINTVLDKRDSSGIGYHVCLYQGRLLFQLSNYNYYSATSQVLNDGIWHCCIITVDRDNPSGLNFYVDGQLSLTSNPTNRMDDISNSANLLIGKHKDSAANNFVGALDEVSIFNKVLDSDSICDLYSKGIFSLYSGSRDYIQKENSAILLEDSISSFNGPLESLEKVISLAPGQKYQQTNTVTKKVTTAFNLSGDVTFKPLKDVLTLNFKTSWSQSYERTITESVQLNYEFPYTEINNGYNSFTIYTCVQNYRNKVNVGIYKRQYRTYYSWFGLVKHTYETDPLFICNLNVIVKKPIVKAFGVRENISTTKDAYYTLPPEAVIFK